MAIKIRRSFRAKGRHFTALLLLASLAISWCVAFVPHTRYFGAHTGRGGGDADSARPIRATFIDNDNDSDENNANYQNDRIWLEDHREEQTRTALMEALVQVPAQDALMELTLAGRTTVVLSKGESAGQRSTRNESIPYLVLSPSDGKSIDPHNTAAAAAPAIDDTGSSSSSSLLLPVTPPQLKLLCFAYQARPLSKSVLLTSLNPLLINRDNGLFDNLPWSTWTIDVDKRNRDAANNNVDAKFHLGKRNAYNRFMGRDWKGRSVSLGNLALRLKYMLDDENDSDKESKQRTSNADKDTLDDDDNDEMSSWSSQVLAKRILELEIREMEMELAEWDYQLAVARSNNAQQPPPPPNDDDDYDDQVVDSIEQLEQSRTECMNQIDSAKDALESLIRQSSSSSRQTMSDSSSHTSSSLSSLSSLLDKVANMTTDNGRNAAPYRGAMGYAPLLDTKEDIETSMLPYTSPFDLMREIIEEQLNAQVIGSLLENTSLLPGTLVLGGAIVLRRKTPKKTMTIQGETLSVSDEEKDFGNEGIKGGETLLVECDGDEAIGMSLACNVPIRVEQSLFGRSAMQTVPVAVPLATSDNKSVYDSIPQWELVDKDMSLLVEGQARNQTNREQTSPLFVPRTTTSLFDSMFDGSSDALSSSSSAMFPTDNPIQCLDDYDSLSNSEKARTLTELSNFQGRLPRPRVLRQEKGKGENALDRLLLPLIDESVRRQYLIRDAERRGDKEALEQLQSSKSRRQVAKEKAESARNVGSDDVADWWDNEADLYEALRADVTQDEGIYSRFLDKDEWYERDRVARAKRIKKSSFGNLLDGVE